MGNEIQLASDTLSNIQLHVYYLSGFLLKNPKSYTIKRAIFVYYFVYLFIYFWTVENGSIDIHKNDGVGYLSICFF